MKYWRGDPLEAAAGEQQLIKMFKAKNIKTKIGDANEFINDVAVLKKGIEDSWGYDHIFTYVRPGDSATRTEQIRQAFGLPNSNVAVHNIIQEGLENGVKQADGSILWVRPDGRYLHFIIGTSSPGSITTVIPGT